jgi:hypothetical protein
LSSQQTLAQVAEFWPDAKLKTQNPKPKTQNPKLKTQYSIQP